MYYLFDNDKISINKMNEVWAYSLNRLKSYDLFILTHPDDHILNDNGIRSVDTSYRKEIHEIIRKIILDNELPYVSVRGDPISCVTQSYRIIMSLLDSMDESCKPKNPLVSEIILSNAIEALKMEQYYRLHSLEKMPHDIETQIAYAVADCKLLLDKYLYEYNDK